MAFRGGGHAADMTDAGRVDAVVSVGTGLRGFVELELRDFGPVGTAARMLQEPVLAQWRNGPRRSPRGSLGSPTAYGRSGTPASTSTGSRRSCCATTRTATPRS